MAFTDPQKTQIRTYMGWPSRLYDSSSALEQSMIVVGADTNASAVILGLLTSLADLDTRLTDALSRIKVNKTGTTELPGQMEVSTLRSEGRRLVGRLSSILGVHVIHDVFSASFPQRNNSFVLS